MLIVEHNVETNEVVEREMNAQELAQWKADNAEIKAAQAEAAAKEIARQALLDRLGINGDEAKLLLG
jgi:hypothetical protein